MATNSASPAKRLLPVGIQDFPDIRERGFVYVDKTARVYELITGSGKAFFLSRPRRFGKSLLCSTLEAVFEGRRELFGEIAGRPALAIDSLGWEWKPYPVIRIDLYAGEYSKYGAEGLYDTLRAEMRDAAEKYGIELQHGEQVASQFKRLIKGIWQKTGEKVVVVIDEYDCPLTSTLNKRDIHIEMRDVLKAFYGVLKSYDKYLRFIFLTGVSKFASVSIFSELNQITDLTFDPRYADICGLTQEEVTANFGPEIDGVLERTGRNRDKYMDELRLFYNGYRFSKAPLTVYNPFGMLNHFENGGEFQPYWYRSGTPTLLTDLINARKVDIQNLSKMQAGYEDFDRFDIDELEPEPLLYQTGYLTIVDYDEDRQRFTLDYPNIEVRSAFAKSLAAYNRNAASERSNMHRIELSDALNTGDVDGVMNSVKHNMAEIPYEVTDGSKEYFLLTVKTMFTILGFQCLSNVKISAVGIDMVVKARRIVYCFQVALDGSAEEALAQIDREECLVPLAGYGTEVIKVGVNFDSKTRNIGGWAVG